MKDFETTALQIKEALVRQGGQYKKSEPCYDAKGVQTGFRFEVRTYGGWWAYNGEYDQELPNDKAMNYLDDLVRNYKEKGIRITYQIDEKQWMAIYIIKI